MSLRPLYVVGTAGLAREMAQLALQIDPKHETWDFKGFIAASSNDIGSSLTFGPVAGDDAWLLDSELAADIVIGVGYPALRACLLGRYLERGDRFSYPTLVHPTALIDRAVVELGQGNAITAGCILTTDIRIGSFNLLNWHTSVGHDAVIGDFNVINPSVNISGGVTIGDKVLIGTGAQILEQLSLGSDSTIGAGAVVTRNVADGITVAGVPARPLERRPG